MDTNAFKHELIFPNEKIPVKIFRFSAYNDLRIIPFHWHGSAEILYVRRGRLNIWMHKKKYELKANDFIYINSKEVHSTQSPEDNEVIVLQIPGDFLETFSSNQSLHIHCNSLEIGKYKHFTIIRQILYEMYVRNEKKGDAYHLKIYALLFELGYLLVKHFKTNEANISITTQKHLDRLSEICAYIKQNYREDITLHSVANEFGYSPQHLSRMFPKYTSSTFSAYLNSIRLNRAFKQVMDTDLSMLSIAENNGFSNVKAFNKIFKEIYGMSATTYRKKQSNNK